MRSNMLWRKWITRMFGVSWSSMRMRLLESGTPSPRVLSGLVSLLFPGVVIYIESKGWRAAGGAITYIISESRNFYAAEQYVLRLGNEFVTQATASASSELASQVLVLGNASAVLQAIEPSSLIGAFGSSQYTLQPFDQLAGIAATTVGAIYLIIVSSLTAGRWQEEADR